MRTHEYISNLRVNRLPKVLSVCLGAGRGSRWVKRLVALAMLMAQVNDPSNLPKFRPTGWHSLILPRSTCRLHLWMILL